MRLLREARQEDTRKTYRLKVADITNRLNRRTITTQRNLELIPFHRHHLFILQFHSSFHDAGNMLLSYAHHVLLAQRYMVTIESLIVVQRVICIDILYIRLQRRRCTIWITLTHLWRVTLCTIKVLITQEHRCLGAIKIIATIVMIVISSRVIQWREIILFPHSQHRLIYLATQCCHIIGIWFLSFILEVPLLLC